MNAASPMFLAWPIVLLAAAAAVGLILLLVKKPRAGVGVLAGILVLLVGVLFLATVSYPDSTTERAAVRAQRVRAVPIHVEETLDPDEVRTVPGGPPAAEAPEWSPEDARFLADVYPSARSATFALRHRLSEEAGKVWQGAEPPELVTVVGPPGATGLFMITRSCRELWPKARIEETNDARYAGMAREANELRVRVHFAGESGIEWAGPDVGSAGSAVLTVRGPAGTASANAAFVRKIWADDFDRYNAESTQAGRGGWVLGVSPGPCSTRGEAEQKALLAAAKQLAPSVQRELRRMSPSLPLAQPSQLGPLASDQIAGRLESSGMVKDRFLQRFSRPYGDVWKASVLVDAQSARISMLASSIQADAARLIAAERMTRSSWARIGTSILGLGVLITLVYFLLNAATRGYYLWRLRAIAVVAALAAAFALIVLA